MADMNEDFKTVVSCALCVAGVQGGGGIASGISSELHFVRYSDGQADR